jgi:Helix-turn-helix
MRKASNISCISIAKICVTFFYTKGNLIVTLILRYILHIEYFGLFCNLAVSKFKIMDIAEQIKKIRKEQGLSQQDVADKLSMNRVQYNRIETGKSDLQ